MKKDKWPTLADAIKDSIQDIKSLKSQERLAKQKDSLYNYINTYDPDKSGYVGPKCSKKAKEFDKTEQKIGNNEQLLNEFIDRAIKLNDETVLDYLLYYISDKKLIKILTDSYNENVSIFDYVLSLVDSIDDEKMLNTIVKKAKNGLICSSAKKVLKIKKRLSK
jgi:hypothetical protein